MKDTRTHIAIIGMILLQGTALGQLLNVTLPVWTRLNDTLYLVNDTHQLNFADARSACLSYNADLVTIKSEEINDFLTSLVTPPSDRRRCFWMGLTDMDVEGQFRWLDDTPLSYENWAENQPDNDNDCACLWSSRRSEEHGQWDSDGCFTHNYFICQQFETYVFELGSIRSNPGTARVSCAVAFESGGLPPSADSLKVAVGRTLASARSIPFTTTMIDDDERRNNTYVIDDIGDEEDVFCYVGESSRADGSNVVLFPPLEFFVLPQLTQSPDIVEINSTFITISWIRWSTCFDVGDGPIVDYRVYIRRENGDWEVANGTVSAPSRTRDSRAFVYTVAGLAPRTEYGLSVGTQREGVGGEGPLSPAMTVRTLDFSVGAEERVSTAVDVIIPWGLLGLSLAGHVAMVAVLLVFRTKRDDGSKPSKTEPGAYENTGTTAQEQVRTYESLKRSGSDAKHAKEQGNYTDLDLPTYEYVNGDECVLPDTEYEIPIV